MFLIVMVVGLAGLAVMAIPALIPHGAASPSHGHAGHVGHGAAGGRLPSHAGHALLPARATAPGEPTPGAGAELVPASHAEPAGSAGIVRWLPTPRGVFTGLALYGAFGNALVEAFHLTPLWATLGALVPSFLVDRFAVRPLWNLVFRLHAQPSASLGDLVLSDAVAVVPFRNGRGIVSTNREGRTVQLAARLCDDQASLTVKVGDRLRIEDVDSQHERVTVSVLRGQ
jgi:hypothetical protein